MSKIESTFIRRMLQHAWERRLFKIGGKWYTRGDIFSIVPFVAGWLVSLGVKRGDKVAIHLEDGLDLILVHLACIALGVVRIPINYRYKLKRTLSMMEDGRPVLVVTRNPKCFPEWVRTVTEVGRGSAPKNLWTMSDDDITCVMFTSGTEKRPKGVPMTLGKWFNNITGLLEKCWEINRDDCVFISVPLFHYHGLVLGVFGALLLGSSVVLPVHRRFFLDLFGSPRMVPPSFRLIIWLLNWLGLGFWEEQTKFDPTVPPDPESTFVFGVPENYRQWLKCMAMYPKAFAKKLISGSDVLPEFLLRKVFKIIGIWLINRYGLTETGIVAAETVRQEGRRKGSVGRKVPGIKIRIDEDAKIGRQGEVQIKGNSVLTSYVPFVDGAFTADGWFKTGNIGIIDEDGFLFFIDRGKDMWCRKGENISPAQLDASFLAVKGVTRAVSYLVMDPQGLSHIILVVISDGSLTGKALSRGLDAMSAELSGMERPDKYIFADASKLPLNDLGKLERARMEEVFGNPYL